MRWPTFRPSIFVWRIQVCPCPAVLLRERERFFAFTFDTLLFERRAFFFVLMYFCTPPGALQVILAVFDRLLLLGTC